VPFSDIRKLSFDRARGKVLILSNSDPSSPQGMQRQFCEPSALDGLDYRFDDAETGETDLKFSASTQIVDYVARVH
jgi:hypothetical protein